MRGQEHLRGGQVGPGGGRGKKFWQRSGSVKAGGRQVDPPVGQLFGVANDQDGGRRLRFCRGSSLGVNFRRAKRQKTRQQQKEKNNRQAELGSDGGHAASIAGFVPSL